MLKPSFATFLRRALVLVLGICLGCAVMMAQSTTEGAIGGTIYDATGAVVPKARIVLRNNGTNAEQATESDASGYFRSSNLQPGTYTVTVSGQGLATYKASQVIVSVGSLTEVSPHLGVAGTTETVEVTAAAPQINYVSPDFANTLDQVAIASLPINGGRWSNFALLTPTVVSNSSGFGLLSFRGISTLLNNNTVDGADNNQAFFSEERGRTRIGYSTPKEAVQEFQVNTSNYSAEYGRSAGGVVNTVTKSGTNAIHGSGYFYDRDNVWGAASAFTQIAVQPTAGGPFSVVNFKPTDWRKMAGGGVGGPLIKDKLFMYVAYDWMHRNFPGTAVTTNPNVFFALPTCNGTAPWSSGATCAASSQVGTLAARVFGANNATNDQLVGDPATGLWARDLNGLNSMLGPVLRNGEQNILYPKLDWAIDSKNHASFSFNRMRWASPAGIQTQATNTFATNSFGNDFVKETWGVAKLDTAITSNFGNELRFQYGRDFEFEFAQGPTAYETNNLLHAGAPSAPAGYTNPLGLPPQISITNGFTFGVPTFLQRPAFPDEVRAQYADTMTWTHNKHTLKYGFDVSHVDDLSQNLRTQFGSFSYSNLLNYFSDLNKANSCTFTPSSGPTANVPCYSSYSQAFGPLGFEFTSMDYAFFAQDDWKWMPRLTVSAGLRYEFEKLPDPFAALVNPLVELTQHKPSDRNNFGPRLGFAWQPTKDGKTVVRGGYGIYYGRIINSTIFSALTSTGVSSAQITYSASPTSNSTFTCAQQFPVVLGGPPACTPGKSVVFFDRHFQNPQVHQFDLTLEREVGWGTVVHVSYLGSLGRELPGFADININPPASTITYNVLGGGPIHATILTEPLFTSRPNTAFGSMTDIFSGINSRYDAFVVQVDHRFSHNIQFSANYTRSRSTDFAQNESTFNDTNDLFLPLTQPGAMAAEKGPSIYDVPNRFVANAVITSPWKRTGWVKWFANDWEMDPVYQIQSGLPYSLKTSGNPAGGLGGGINGSNGDFRTDILGRNSFRMPGVWVTDLRLAKHFKFEEKYEVQLSGDFFNIFNKQNVTSVNTTGYNIGSGSSAVSTCGSTTLAPCLAFSPTFGSITNSNSNFQYSPRQIQLGARFQF